MVSPFQFYFLESMIVLAETGEVINVSCGIAKRCLPPARYTTDWNASTELANTVRLNRVENVLLARQKDAGRDYTVASSSKNEPPTGRNADDMREPVFLPAFPPAPPNNDPPDRTSDLEAPRRRDWIRMLPQFVMETLLVLFGWRIMPAVLVEIQSDSANMPPDVPERQVTPAPEAFDVDQQ